MRPLLKELALPVVMPASHAAQEARLVRETEFLFETCFGTVGHAVAQLLQALYYKPEGQRFDS